MWLTRRRMIWTASAIGLLVFVGLLLAMTVPNRAGVGRKKRGGGEAVASDADTEEIAIQVKTIHPRRDPNFLISVQQLASVEGFARTDLRARVPGTVKYIQRNIGDRVTKGELLVEIDVPDLVQEQMQKEAVVEQRKNDLVLAQSQIKFARAAVEIARCTVEQKRAEVAQAQATRDFRRKRWMRFVTLQKQNAVDANVVDEEERDYRAAEAGWEGAKAGVKKAQADVSEKDASLETAIADVELKESLIRVAQKDREKARALAEYAKITAPFDGVITSRHVDVGTFVQNAATAQTEPLVCMARTDLITVVMKVPDNAAPFVTAGTDAIIQLDELQGMVLRGKVTRFSPAIQDKDRTMRVEVDLFNGSEAEYQRFAANGVATFLAPLSASRPQEAAVLRLAGHGAWAQNMKGGVDPFPLFPRLVTGKAPSERRLMPGMTGYMRLLLQKFQDSYLIPSAAIFSRGGKPYIMVVRDEMSCQLPVRVQMNDGKLAKVTVGIPAIDQRPGEHELYAELTGDEEVIVSRQVEIGEGHAVTPVHEPW